ncbi:MAG: hypothetical protein GXO11_03455 [Epsilonproteobacteria bacterium]|nr:hypothetical protein [Campylobacterota bacterium]
MKKIISSLLIAGVTLLALPNDPVELSLIAKAAEKKAIVLATMKLDQETQKKFGDLYDQYQEKMMKLRIQELSIIAEYAKNYNNLTNDTADKLIANWMDVEEAEHKLKKEYIEKFKKVLPSSEVIRYYQIENKFELMRELQRSELIPLAIPAQLQTTK